MDVTRMPSESLPDAQPARRTNRPALLAASISFTIGLIFAISGTAAKIKSLLIAGPIIMVLGVGILILSFWDYRSCSQIWRKSAAVQAVSASPQPRPHQSSGVMHLRNSLLDDYQTHTIKLSGQTRPQFREGPVYT